VGADGLHGEGILPEGCYAVGAMNILQGFAPYIAFFLLMRVVSVEVGLWAALSVAGLSAGREWARSGSLKVLEVGSVCLFAALAVFTRVAHWGWTVMAVRLAVDAGLLAIVLASLAIGRPFTLQYARERVPEQYWNAPLFLIINRRITWAWAAAFAVMVATHAAVVLQPGVSWWLDLAITILVLAAAFRFTTWYPERARRNAGVPV
jgi:hypothetical protein